MKRRNFFGLLLAAAGVPAIAKKMLAAPTVQPLRMQTYQATLCSTAGPYEGPEFGQMKGPIGSPGPVWQVGPPNTNAFHWTTSKPYQAGDVVTYMNGWEQRFPPIHPNCRSTT